MNEVDLANPSQLYIREIELELDVASRYGNDSVRGVYTIMFGVFVSREHRCGTHVMRIQEPNAAIRKGYARHTHHHRGILCSCECIKLVHVSPANVEKRRSRTQHLDNMAKSRTAKRDS